MNRFIIGILLALTALSSRAANVVLEGCDKLTFNKNRAGGCQVLKGNVRFRQDRATMYCDSAYFYSAQNSFDAYGHVRVVQDSMTLTSGKMFYDGNTKLMRVRDNITLITGKMKLTTQRLDFYRDKGYAYYDCWAKIVDPSFELTSRIGYYYTDTKKALFKSKVVLNGTDYRILTDSLAYNSRSSEATVMGPSVIYRDQYIINTRHAYMNNAEGIFKLYRRSVVDNEDKTQHVVADTILYNRNKGTAQLYGNIQAYDLNQHMAMYGGVGILHRQPTSSGYLTKNAYVKEFSTDDTLYVRADTLKLTTLADSSRLIEGLHDTRFFRSDFQGVCDTMKIFSKDSLVYMQGNPVLWSDANQLTGDTVRLYLKNKRPDWLHITGNALVVQRDDSVNYNQIKGNDLQGFFLGNALRKVVVNGNAMSVYFPKDKKGDLIGVNQNMGAKMTIFMNEKRKLDKIVLEPGTEGMMYPPFEAPDEVLFLKGFSWKQDVRPHSSSDVTAFTK